MSLLSMWKAKGAKTEDAKQTGAKSPEKKDPPSKKARVDSGRKLDVDPKSTTRTKSPAARSSVSPSTTAAKSSSAKSPPAASKSPTVVIKPKSKAVPPSPTTAAGTGSKSSAPPSASVATRSTQTTPSTTSAPSKSTSAATATTSPTKQVSSVPSRSSVSSSGTPSVTKIATGTNPSVTSSVGVSTSVSSSSTPTDVSTKPSTTGSTPISSSTSSIGTSSAPVSTSVSASASSPPKSVSSTTPPSSTGTSTQSTSPSSSSTKSSPTGNKPSASQTQTATGSKISTTTKPSSPSKIPLKSSDKSPTKVIKPPKTQASPKGPLGLNAASKPFVPLEKPSTLSLQTPQNDVKETNSDTPAEIQKNSIKIDPSLDVLGGQNIQSELELSPTLRMEVDVVESSFKVGNPVVLVPSSPRAQQPEAQPLPKIIPALSHTAVPLVHVAEEHVKAEPPARSPPLVPPQPIPKITPTMSHTAVPLVHVAEEHVKAEPPARSPPLLPPQPLPKITPTLSHTAVPLVYVAEEHTKAEPPARSPPLVPPQPLPKITPSISHTAVPLVYVAEEHTKAEPPARSPPLVPPQPLPKITPSISHTAVPLVYVAEEHTKAEPPGRAPPLVPPQPIPGIIPTLGHTAVPLVHVAEEFTKAEPPARAPPLLPPQPLPKITPTLSHTAVPLVFVAEEHTKLEPPTRPPPQIPFFTQIPFGAEVEAIQGTFKVAPPNLLVSAPLVQSKDINSHSIPMITSTLGHTPVPLLYLAEINSGVKLPEIDPSMILTCDAVESSLKSGLRPEAVPYSPSRSDNSFLSLLQTDFSRGGYPPRSHQRGSTSAPQSPLVSFNSIGGFQPPFVPQSHLPVSAPQSPFAPKSSFSMTGPLPIVSGTLPLTRMRSDPSRIFSPSMTSRGYGDPRGFEPRGFLSPLPLTRGHTAPTRGFEPSQADEFEVILEKKDGDSKKDSKAQEKGLEESAAEKYKELPPVLSKLFERDVGISKSAVRLAVWNRLEAEDLVLFPRPTHGRIPNFVGCNAAAKRLASIPEFRKAKCVKVNPSWAQAAVRLDVLRQGKILLMPHAPPPQPPNTWCYELNPKRLHWTYFREATTKPGARKYGKRLALHNIPPCDMIVVGSVAVSTEGTRLGKGTGYGDIEYAMMRECGAVTDDTIVVTTVHDTQIVPSPEELLSMTPVPGAPPPPREIAGSYWLKFSPILCLPSYLMQPHDVPVDIIVTPTRVIYTDRKLAKPKGMLWENVSLNMLRELPILKSLQNKQPVVTTPTPKSSTSQSAPTTPLQKPSSSTTTSLMSPKQPLISFPASPPPIPMSPLLPYHSSSPSLSGLSSTSPSLHSLRSPSTFTHPLSPSAPLPSSSRGDFPPPRGFLPPTYSTTMEPSGGFSHGYHPVSSLPPSSFPPTDVPLAAPGNVPFMIPAGGQSSQYVPQDRRERRGDSGYHHRSRSQPPGRSERGRGRRNSYGYTYQRKQR